MIGDIIGKTAVVEANRSQFEEIGKASDEFQARLVKSMVQEMRKGLDDEFSSMPGSSIYEDEINTILANKLSSESNLGLNHLLFNQMAKLQLAQDLQTNNKTKQ